MFLIYGFFIDFLVQYSGRVLAPLPDTMGARERMPFIISDTVMFHEVKGSLTNIDTQDEIRLPPTAVCILLMLLSNNGSPIERGELMEQVNIRFGFDLSNNTLTQYISLLRKNIRNLGIEPDVIMTVPKVGFYISADVKVERKVDEVYESIEEGVTSKRNGRTFFIMILVIMGLILISEAIFLSLSVETLPTEYPLVKNGKIEGCDLYLPVNLERVKLPLTLQKASKLAEHYLPCTPGSVFIYDISAINFLNGTGKVYLSRCTGLPGEERYAVCSEVAFNE